MMSTEQQQQRKTILITGANKGIGYECALALAKENHVVILACRDEVKGRESAEKIKSLTNNTVHVLRMDVSSMQSVKDSVNELKKMVENVRLDVLLCNAGIMATERKVTTDDGFELQMATNFVGHALLVELLLKEGILVQSEDETVKPTRIVHQSSMAHTMIDEDAREKVLSEWNAENSTYDRWYQYYLSKLAQILYAFGQYRKLKKNGINNISVQTCHPGVVLSDLWQQCDTTPESVASEVGMPVLTASEGAKTALAAINSTDVKECSFWVNEEPSFTSILGMDEDLQDEFYEQTLKVIHKYLL